MDRQMPSEDLMPEVDALTSRDPFSPDARPARQIVPLRLSVIVTLGAELRSYGASRDLPEVHHPDWLILSGTR